METGSDLFVWGLWESQTEDIIDFRLGEPDCDSHKKTNAILLAQREKENRDKHGEKCHEK